MGTAVRLCSALAGAILIGAGATGPVAAQAVSGGPIAEDGYFEIVQPLAKGVWLIRQAKPFHLQPIGNVTVIEQSDGLVMVDSGGSPGSGRRIVGLIRGLSPKPVKAVIISQWHGDKPLGLPVVLEAWPEARVIATAATRAHLADPKTMNTPGRPDAKANTAMLDGFRESVAYLHDQATSAKTEASRQHWAAAERLFTQYVHDMDGALTLQPSEAFTSSMSLPDRRAPVSALFLGRADTDGDAVVWLPRQRILVAGETVVAPIPFGFEAYPADWLNVLARLKAYPFRLLVPGHGEPQATRAYVDRLAALIVSVREQVGPLAKSGLSLKDVQAKVDLTAEARGFVGDDPWLLQWFDQYWTKPFVASAYKEALGQPIVQNLQG